MRHMLSAVSITGVLAVLWSPAPLMAQATTDPFPSKPVTFIVAAAAGGPIDSEIRLYSTKMSAVLGQPVLVDYRPGAGTTIGTAYVAKSAPNGYTLLGITPAFCIIPAFYKSLPFDTLKDFAPVSQMGKRTSVLVVRTSFPAQSLKEYIAYAKANPGKINYATSGAGGNGHLAGAWLHGGSETKVTWIHYKGLAPALVDIMAGTADVTTSAVSVALPLVKAGKIRALAHMSTDRGKLMPDIPTVQEQGFPWYDWSTWVGFAAPAATPAAIVNKLSESFARVAREPETIATLDAEGATAVGNTPAQFRQLIVAETERWRKVIQDNGIALTQ